MSINKKSKTYHFNDEWEINYFFKMIKEKCVCLICRSTISLPKKGNIERHYNAHHKNYENDFPQKSEKRKMQLEILLNQLEKQQSIFTKPTIQSKAATMASFQISFVLAKHKKPFADGEMIKEAFIKGGEVLFANFKNKSEIMTAIKDVQLSRQSVTRRLEIMEMDVIQKLKHDINDCKYFSLQFDESTDIIDIAQLCIYIRMSFNDMTSKEDLLTIIPLKGNTRGEDIYSEFIKFVEKFPLPLYKLVCITTDGAPAMRGRLNGFVALCKKNDDFPDFISFHCVIHQHALCAKMLNMKEVMDIAFKIVNSIRSRSLQRRLFKIQLEENESKHSDLLLHTDVRWLSRGRFLERFQELLPEISQFLQSRGDQYDQLTNPKWLLNLAFLTDITNHLNKCNLELQGKNRTIIELLSSINSFKFKLLLFKSQLSGKDLKNFPSLLAIKEKGNNILLDDYIAEIQNIVNEFENRFQDISRLNPILLFLSFPFGNDEVEEITSKIATFFDINLLKIENEVIALKSDIFIKARASENSYWSLLNEETYPCLRAICLQLTAYFGSTYLCESAFSEMKILKCKYRSTLTDEHLKMCLHLAVTNYVPSFEQLADNMQCHASTSKDKY